jgi:hypothetical protein
MDCAVHGGYRTLVSLCTKNVYLDLLNIFFKMMNYGMCLRRDQRNKFEAKYVMAFRLFHRVKKGEWSASTSCSRCNATTVGAFPAQVEFHREVVRPL